VLQEDKLVKEKGKPNTTLRRAELITNAEGGFDRKESLGKDFQLDGLSGEAKRRKSRITIFDHPKNSRRARWHVRVWFVRANPSAGHVHPGDKSRRQRETGAGRKLHFRYRLIIHEGGVKTSIFRKCGTSFEIGGTYAHVGFMLLAARPRSEPTGLNSDTVWDVRSVSDARFTKRRQERDLRARLERQDGGTRSSPTSGLTSADGRTIAR